MATSRLSNKVHINDSYRGNFSNSFQIESQKYSLYELIADTTSAVVTLPQYRPDGLDIIEIENIGTELFHVVSFEGTIIASISSKNSFIFSNISGSWVVDRKLTDELASVAQYSDVLFGDDSPIANVGAGTNWQNYAFNSSDESFILFSPTTVNSFKYNKITKKIDRVINNYSLSAGLGEIHYQQISSNKFLRAFTESTTEFGYRVVNVDGATVTEGPKLVSTLGPEGGFSEIHAIGSLGNDYYAIVYRPLTPINYRCIVVHVDPNTDVITIATPSYINITGSTSSTFTDIIYVKDNVCVVCYGSGSYSYQGTVTFSSGTGTVVLNSAIIPDFNTSLISHMELLSPTRLMFTLNSRPYLYALNPTTHLISGSYLSRDINIPIRSLTKVNENLVFYTNLISNVYSFSAFRIFNDTISQVDDILTFNHSYSGDIVHNFIKDDLILIAKSSSSNNFVVEPIEFKSDKANEYTFNFKGIFDDLEARDIVAENITTQTFTTQSIITGSIFANDATFTNADIEIANINTLYNDSTAHLNDVFIDGNVYFTQTPSGNQYISINQGSNLFINNGTQDGVTIIGNSGANAQYNGQNVTMNGQNIDLNFGDIDLGFGTSATLLRLNTGSNADNIIYIGAATMTTPIQIQTAVDIDGFVTVNNGAYFASDSTVDGVLYANSEITLNGDFYQFGGSMEIAGSLTTTNGANLNINADGVGIVTVAEDLYVTGDVDANNIYNKQTSIGSTGTNIIVDSFAHATWRAAKYVLTFTGTEYQTVEFLVIHDGVDTYTTTYAELYSGAAQVFTVSADIVGSNVEIYVNSTITGAIDITALRQV